MARTARLQATWFVIVVGWFVSGSTAEAQIWVGIQSPAPNSLVITSELNVVVQTMGPAARVTASVESREITLTKASGSGYTGTLSLEGEAPGEKVLVIRAYDADEAANTASVPFVLGGGVPGVLVHEPVSGTLLRGSADSLRLRATCVSTAPSCVFTAPITTTGRELDIPLSDASLTEDRGDGSRLTSLAVRDSFGQTNVSYVTLYVEPHERLQAVITTDGEIVDFDGARALVRSSDGKRVSLWTRSGLAHVVYEGPDSISTAQLHSRGALLGAENSSSRPRPTWLWLDGTLIGLSVERARANGKWLAFVAKDGDGERLTLRDLLSGQDVWTTPMISVSNPIQPIEVAPNGDVSWRYATAGAFWKHGDRVIELGEPYGSAGPLPIDGVNCAASSASGGISTAALYTGAQNIVVCRAYNPSICYPPVLSDGWAAYMTYNSVSLTTPYVPLRRHSGGGVEEFTAIRNRTPNGEYSSRPIVTPVAINLLGETILGAEGRSYLARTPTTATEIAKSTAGRFVYREGWYWLVGGAVFRVVLPDDPTPLDAGVSLPELDAGAVDASGQSLPSVDAGTMQAADAGDGAPADLDANIARDSAAHVVEESDAQVDEPRDVGPGSEGAAPNVSSRSEEGCAASSVPASFYDDQFGWTTTLGMLVLAAGRRRKCAA